MRSSIRNQNTKEFATKIMSAYCHYRLLGLGFALKFELQNDGAKSYKDLTDESAENIIPNCSWMLD